ncbi:LbetaH domain-containing protein [Gillisia marina]|uniref:acetyltransferase n=1 Tax=Gillisia marina TaxID=1167637 RepID=UPI00029A6978|nr:acetyltransferase [Gillisia marina]
MDNTMVDLSQYDSSFSLFNKLSRIVWNFCYWFLFRPFFLPFFKGWRRFVLRSFGAKIGEEVNIYASARIWAPWNLEIGDHSSIGPKVDCYNQGKIVIGNHTNISQKTYLCASTHDFTISNFPLVLKPIWIKNQVWIAADAFIAPGVTIEEGAVVAARAGVFKNVEAWTVVGGNPAKKIKQRIIN